MIIGYLRDNGGLYCTDCWFKEPVAARNHFRLLTSAAGDHQGTFRVIDECHVCGAKLDYDDITDSVGYRARQLQTATADTVGPRQCVSSGSPFEDAIGFSRAVRVGNLVAVSGTAPLGDDGKTVAVGDLYLQTWRCIDVAQRTLQKAGASLADVVRTRVLLTSTKNWERAARAHQEAFGRVRPASTFVQVAGLLDPEWLVEMEFDAIVAERSPADRP